MDPDRFRAADPTPLPAPPFVLVPVFCVPLAPPGLPPWQEPLYRWALEQARAVARPSLLERDLLAVWN
jgi:hypothetical protein